VRRIYACELAIDADEVTTARALVRRWLAAPWGPWPTAAHGGEGLWRPAGDVTIRWRTLAGPDASVRELVLEEPFADDRTMQQSTMITVGQDGQRGFVHVEGALRPVGTTMSGPIVFEHGPPELLAELVDALTCSDGRRRLASTATLLDIDGAATFARLVMDPARRLPVVLMVLDRMFVEDQAHALARAASGFAHVFGVARSDLASVGERSAIDLPPGLPGRLWWATPPGRVGDPRQHAILPKDMHVSRWGVPAWGVLRDLYAVSAFRASRPATAARLAAATARRRVAELEARTSAVELDAELLAEYDRDLRALEDAEDRIVSLEREVERLTADLDGFSVAFDAALKEALGSDDDDVEAEIESLGHAIRLARQHCAHLVFLDQAQQSADRWQYRRPDVVYRALRRLDRLAGAWRRDELSQGWLTAAKAAGLPWKPAISVTARNQYRDDYVRTWDGREVMLGPHLSWGNTAANCVRAYLYIDDQTRTVVVGHAGEHLRDTTKPHG